MLSKCQLMTAITISLTEDEAEDEEELLSDIDEILATCRHLVAISRDEEDIRENDTVGLAHYTVKEYLLSPPCNEPHLDQFRFQEDHAEYEMTEICLSYLRAYLNLAPHREYMLPRSPHAPFKSYAEQYWCQHATRSSHLLRVFSDDLKNDQVLKEVHSHGSMVPLLGGRRCLTCGIVLGRLMGSSRISDTSINLLLEYADPNPPVFRGDSDIIYLGPRGIPDTFGTPLQEALAFPRSYATIKKLLELGASINAPPTDQRDTALHESIANRGFTARMLIKAGADVNFPPTNRRGTPLQEAVALNSAPWLIKSLYSHGADVNAPANRIRGTALQEALRIRDAGIANFLLDVGADPLMPRSENWKYGTCLQMAVQMGDHRLVRRLWLCGVNVNEICPTGAISAIAEAARAGDRDIVSFLLAAGAVDGEEFYPEGALTALQEAIEGNHHNVIAEFLERQPERCAKALIFKPLVEEPQDRPEFEGLSPTEAPQDLFETAAGHGNDCIDPAAAADARQNTNHFAIMPEDRLIFSKLFMRSESSETLFHLLQQWSYILFFQDTFSHFWFYRGRQAGSFKQPTRQQEFTLRPGKSFETSKGAPVREIYYETEVLDPNCPCCVAQRRTRWKVYRVLQFIQNISRKSFYILLLILSFGIVLRFLPSRESIFLYTAKFVNGIAGLFAMAAELLEYTRRTLEWIEAVRSGPGLFVAFHKALLASGSNMRVASGVMPSPATITVTNS
ncbi:hypothetical protein ABW19_dt0208457 [Dactylella cylindrospora]|nr:hypothetical protein ABW19_dt0208457 [Dactylella cylindrospora]